MDVFEAIADPTRREIISCLGGGPLDASQIAGKFEISQPGISRHLKRLLESGLVNRTTEGQRRIYRLEPGGLKRVEEWASSRLQFWERHMDKLKSLLEDENDEHDSGSGRKGR